MKKTINVIDYMMGTGKTRYISRFMLENGQDKYLYVTPLLSESNKMTSKCARIEMKTPLDKDVNGNPTGKGEHLLELLEAGANISTTHQMFKSLSRKHIEQIERQKYVIILDEVLDYIQPYEDYSKDDIKDLFDRGDLVADKDNLGKVSMMWDVSRGNHYKNLHDICEMGMLYSTIKPENLLNLQIPPVMLDAAKEVIIMTYMFNASSMAAFFKLHKYNTNFLVIPELSQKEKTVKESLRTRLEFIDIKGADKIISNFRDTSMSHSWWDKALKEGYAKDFLKCVSNWLVNNSQYSNSFFYCTPKNVVAIGGTRNALLDKYSLKYLRNTRHFTDASYNMRGKPTAAEDENLQKEDSDKLDTEIRPPKWLTVNTKATNLYVKRNLCLCLMNVYPNMNIQYYLQNYSEKVEPDAYALAEVLQFIWRGCIRNPEGENMKLYMASPRMKALVLRWLSE